MRFALLYSLMSVADLLASLELPCLSLCRTPFLAPTVCGWPTYSLALPVSSFPSKLQGSHATGGGERRSICEIKRVKNGRVLLIPASDSTSGHGTTGMAKFYERELGELLRSAPRLVPYHRTREGHP